MSILSGQIKNPRHPTIRFTGNVLIDTCSTATYITEQAANKLNLKFSGHEWRYLNTLGSTVRKKFKKTHPEKVTQINKEQYDMSKEDPDKQIERFRFESHGPIFTCICCMRDLFQRGVVELKGDIEKTILKEN